MLQLRSPTVLVHATSLVLWALIAFTGTAWVLRGVGNPMSQGPGAQGEEVVMDVDTTATARSLGLVSAAPVAAPTLASRFQLVGVLVGGPSQGAALIAVDGKPAKPFRVGATVADDLVLQSVQGRRVNLGVGMGMDAAASLTLELPVRK
jgi:general secretion pathway protein C